MKNLLLQHPGRLAFGPLALLLLVGCNHSTPPRHAATFIDVHELGPGKVTAAAVAEAHRKDLAVQGQYGVKFIDYWVDEANGVVYCLSEAPDANAVIETHRHAHGLLPARVSAVTPAH